MSRGSTQYEREARVLDGETEAQRAGASLLYTVFCVVYGKLTLGKRKTERVIRGDGYRREEWESYRRGTAVPSEPRASGVAGIAVN